MDFELPSLPKAVVINSALIAAIGLSALIAMVGFWQLLPAFVDRPAQPGQSALEVNFTYLQTIAPGTDWGINGTARNPSNTSLAGIKVRMFSDGNIQGYEYLIPSLGPGESLDFALKPRIKDSAVSGNHTAQLVVTVPDTLPAEYALGITILD
jgi:hypothetical protein